MCELTTPIISSNNILTPLFTPGVSAACALTESEISHTDSLIGIVAGDALAVLATTTGPLVALHEVVGHGLLGYELTHQQGSISPSYQIDGFDNFKAIGNAHSFQDGIEKFFQWITGYDVNHDNASGFMRPGNGEPNTIGHSLGRDEQSAWLSIAGSLPGLALDTASVVGGLLLRKQHPLLGSTLTTFGLVDNAISSSYPISAALMSCQELQYNANKGHDFANFAIRISRLTDIAANTIAISTAVIWTLFVPLIALFTYLYTKSHINDIVPDMLALKHWLNHAPEEEVERLLENYPQREDFHILDFMEYLLETLPPETLNASKGEILRDWEPKLPKDRIQTTLTITSVIGSVMAVVSKILNAIAPICNASVQMAATVFTYLSPFFIITSVASASYTVYKDLQTPIPTMAKCLSIAKLIVSIASAILIITALFVPGLNLTFFTALIISTFINIGLSYARARVIQKQFEYQQATDATTYNVMHALWERHQQNHTPMGHHLKKWVELVHPEV